MFDVSLKLLVMSRFVLFVLMIVSCLVSKAQNPKGSNGLDSSVTWRIRHNPYIEPTGNYLERKHYDFEYVVGADTVAYNRNYKKLVFAYGKRYHYFYAQGYTSEGSSLDTIFETVALYREDEGKYYISLINGANPPTGIHVPQTASKEFLVADMNLDFGDTLDMGIHHYDRDSLIFIVQEVDSVFTGWDYRKRIRLRSKENSRDYTWVEGVGPISLGGPFGPNCYQFEDWTDLYCWEILEKNSGEIYPEACALLKTEFKPVGIFEQKKVDPLIVKIGVSEWETISGEDVQYEIYNLSGVLIEKGESSSGKIAIPGFRGVGILKAFNSQRVFTSQFFNLE